MKLFSSKQEPDLRYGLSIFVSVMSHPEFLKQKFEKRGCRERSVPAGVRGIPEKLFFPFFSRAACGGTRGGEKWGTAPHPRPRAGCPWQSRLASGLTYIERRFEKFGMTHVGQCQVKLA